MEEDEASRCRDSARAGSICVAARALKRLSHRLNPRGVNPRACEERFMTTLLNQRIDAALTAMRAGIPVVLLDDEDRENEADLVVAAETLTRDVMAQLIRAGGLVCLCLEDERLRQLELPPMVAHNDSAHGTAFTVTIDARHGISTGTSAADRLVTIRAAIAPNAKPADLVRPGHVFPLRAAPGGILARRGHTEGAVDLARLAGLMPAGVVVELMDREGEMLRSKLAKNFARRHGLPVLTIAELVAFRAPGERSAA
jgi:3,4-dihydroxy 2-butanone 4-phosphate synthase